MSSSKKTTSKRASVSLAVFRDNLYTSRMLILPDGRQLSVEQGQVSADAADSAALDYLRQHPDLQPQE
ncbi:hypothetical protein J4P02_19210 [Pseudomonas sp. NFXW11]|uniref:hypothetical protein n=1 Tax=Pseudomonas sp. NFXW11 TaxID=2819531 RepID=UPI003CECAD97